MRRFVMRPIEMVKFGIQADQIGSSVRVILERWSLFRSRSTRDLGDVFSAMPNTRVVASDRLVVRLSHRGDVRLVAIARRIAEVERQLKAAVATTPTGLVRIFGVGPICAARILGEVGDVARFRSRHHFASYNGTAPADAGSGGVPVHRVNLKGNRKLNHAIHMVAITQIRRHTPGRAYYLRKQAEGKSRKEAMRALMRRISDAVFRQLVLDALG